MPTPNLMQKLFTDNGLGNRLRSEIMPAGVVMEGAITLPENIATTDDVATAKAEAISGAVGQCLPKTGGTMTGQIRSTLSPVNDELPYQHSLGGRNIAFGVGGSRLNRGVFDKEHGRWIMYANGAGDVELGTQGTAHNRLIAGATGSLTWQGKNVVRSVGGASAGADGNVNITESNVAYPNYVIGSAPASMQAKMDYLRANRLAFLPADQIIIEKTVDGGQTWVDAGVPDEGKVHLFSGTRAYWVPIPEIDGKRSKLCGLRVTFSAQKYNVPIGTPETGKYEYWDMGHVRSQERYVTLEHFFFWLSSVDDRIRIEVHAATGRKPNEWRAMFDDPKFLASGWSGGDYLKTQGWTVFGGSPTSQPDQYWNWRISFWTDGVNGGALSTNTAYEAQTQSICQIAGFGFNAWTTPNALMQYDHLYSWDIRQNATFPARLSATGLYGKADNAISEIKGGVDSLAGGKLSLHGKTATLAGGFQLDANNGTTKVALVGKPDGSLKWGTESVSESTNIAAGVYDAVTAFMTAHSIT